jgi:hypothetical protein
MKTGISWLLLSLQRKILNTKAFADFMNNSSVFEQRWGIWIQFQLIFFSVLSAFAHLLPYFLIPLRLTPHRAISLGIQQPTGKYHLMPFLKLRFSLTSLWPEEESSKTTGQHQKYWLSVYQTIYYARYVFAVLINDENSITSISSSLSECFAFRIRHEKWSRMRKACSNLSDETCPLSQSRAIKMLQKPFIPTRDMVSVCVCSVLCR